MKFGLIAAALALEGAVDLEKPEVKVETERDAHWCMLEPDWINYPYEDCEFYEVFKQELRTKSDQ